MQNTLCAAMTEASTVVREMQPPRPTKVIAVHLNYASRAAERGRAPAVPSYFFKPPSSVSAGGDVERPPGVKLLGYEGEIAVIVGTKTRSASPETAAAAIGWYAPANDIGVADLRWADRGSSVLSKGHDGFTPLGEPVPADGIDPRTLRLRTHLNGTAVQDDTAANLIFDFATIIADLSRFITLEAGDVILTGTPSGIGTAEPGDVVEVELEGLSRVRSTIVESKVPPLEIGAQPRVTPEALSFARGGNPNRPVTLSSAAREALLQVSVATLTVQLTRHGIRNSFVRGLRATRPELRLLGYAHTLRYLPLREDVRDADTADLNAQKGAIESVAPDDVIVMDARGDAGAGTIGDILAARAMIRGAAGIVTDGGMRDTAAVAQLDLPAYYQAPHAAVLGLIHYPYETQVPIACGGALVMPGDIVVGDADGVVIIPAALAERVAAAAVEQEEREAWALERVLAGESIKGIYPLDVDRTAEFELWRQNRNGGNS